MKPIKNPFNPLPDGMRFKEVKYNAVGFRVIMQRSSALTIPEMFANIDPHDDLAWFAMADWFEENGNEDQAELVRLQQRLRFRYTEDENEKKLLWEEECRMQEILRKKVLPPVMEMTDKHGIVYVYVPNGTFLMGSTPEEDGNSDEQPAHPVEITRGFWMTKYPITQKQYESVIGSNPSHFKSTPDKDRSNHPVEMVSHDDATKFCDKLTEEKKPRFRAALPTEAQWEYACRAGSTTKFNVGHTLTPEDANYSESNIGSTCPVGSYRPNLFGLYDMHGNVWEWCRDWYASDTYKRRVEKALEEERLEKEAAEKAALEASLQNANVAV